MALISCGVDPSGHANKQDGDAPASTPAKPDSDPMAAHDLASGETLDPALSDDKPRPTMQAQVVLDRLGFTPGVIDGKEGLSTRNAVSGFQEANGLSVTGKFDDLTRKSLARWSNIPATRMVTIPAEFAAGPFTTIPADSDQQARLPALGYQTLEEKLAERFHTTVETLLELNPRAAPTHTAISTPDSDGLISQFRSGERVRVPNVGSDEIDPAMIKDPAWRATLASLGVGTKQPKAARIVVSKSKETLKVFDEQDKLVAMFTATMGSSHDPLPLGKWKILGVSYNPKFSYNPKLFWDVPDTTEKQLLPPGPNGPVGVAWIDLSKEHYGIHGTPDPETIGRAESHGCVRLTNWDVARLAQMVSGQTQVLFEA